MLSKGIYIKRHRKYEYYQRVSGNIIGCQMVSQILVSEVTINIKGISKIKTPKY